MSAPWRALYCRGSSWTAFAYLPRIALIGCTTLLHIEEGSRDNLGFVSIAIA